MLRLFNGWTAGGFALTYIIQHHMKRKRKAEEKSDDGNKRQRAKAFEDPSTVTSLEETQVSAPKPKRRAASKKTTEEIPPAPTLLTRQIAATDNVTLEFEEIAHVSDANAFVGEPVKKQTRQTKSKADTTAAKPPRKPRTTKITTSKKSQHVLAESGEKVEV
jgi:hypothetical protein